MGPSLASDWMRSGQVKCGPSGPSAGLRQQRNNSTPEKAQASRMPGMMPAMNNAPIEVSVQMP